MPQTVLAFLAVLLLTTLSLSQRDSKMQAYQARAAAELELMAHGVGTGVIEMIAAKSFDEATTQGNTAAGTDEFTDPSFPADDAGGTSDDVDDYHNVQLVRTFATANDTTIFHVDVSIHYVNDRSERVNDRTYNKEIQVTVRPDSSNSAYSSGTASALTLKRPVAYAPH